MSPPPLLPGLAFRAHASDSSKLAVVLRKLVEITSIGSVTCQKADYN